MRIFPKVFDEGENWFTVLMQIFCCFLIVEILFVASYEWILEPGFDHLFKWIDARN